MMLNMTQLLLILTFSLPLLFSLILALCKKCHLQLVFIAVVVLVMIGVAGLGLPGDREVSTALTFMGETISFSISGTAIWLFLATLLGLLVLFGWYRRSDVEVLNRYQLILLTLSLSFGFVSFFSGQFMIRYIALDIVGLLAALTVLSSFKETSPLKHFIFIFQILRLADLALLASILLINRYAGTLDISIMIDTATGMPESAKMWVFLGLLLALLIKLAIWPFGLWMQRTRLAAPKTSFWISGVLMPVLGFYLLYRINPIIQSEEIFQNLILSIVLLLFFLILLVNGLRAVRADRFFQVSGLMTCFLLAISAVGQGRFIVFYLLAMILHRHLLLILDDVESSVIKVVSALIPIIVNGLFLVFNLGVFPVFFTVGWLTLTALTSGLDWHLTREKLDVETFDLAETDYIQRGQEDETSPFTRFSHWLHKTLRMGSLSNGVYRLSGYLGLFADWLYRNVEQRLDGLWSWMGRNLMRISEDALYAVEIGFSKKTSELMDDALKSLEAYEQNVLQKTLKWDLVWIPVLLVFLLIMLLVL